MPNSVSTCGGTLDRVASYADGQTCKYAHDDMVIRADMQQGKTIDRRSQFRMPYDIVRCSLWTYAGLPEQRVDEIAFG